MKAYELTLTAQSKEAFKTVVKQKLEDKHISLVELAKLIDRPLATVYNFMYNKNRANRFVAAEIANALDINRNDF